MLKIKTDEKSVFLKKLPFESEYGFEYLAADDIAELLGVSRSHAYRIIKTGEMTQQQRRLLECEIFGAVHSWPGWRFKNGFLLSPTDYQYTESDLLRINTMKQRLQNYGVF